MAKQTINLGTAPSGSGGDTPRSAFTKAQSNFDELYTADGVNIKKGATNSTPSTQFSSGAQPAIAAITSSGNDRNGPLQLGNGSNTAASAVLSFIREGSYGVHFGLDTDNVIKIGGWSMGAASYKVWHSGNILAPVTQQGGVPGGGIMETGSNGNGTYIRYADGTMICRHTSTVLTSNTAFGSLFYSTAYAFTFPAQFVGTPSIVTSAMSPNGYFAWTAAEGPASNAQFAARTISGSGSATGYITYVAVGRWF